MSLRDSFLSFVPSAQGSLPEFGGKLEVWELWWKTWTKKWFTCLDKQIKRTGVRLECCLSLQNIIVSEFNYHCILNIAQCVIYIYIHTHDDMMSWWSFHSNVPKEMLDKSQNVWKRKHFARDEASSCSFQREVSLETFNKYFPPNCSQFSLLIGGFYPTILPQPSLQNTQPHSQLSQLGVFGVLFVFVCL